MCPAKGDAVRSVYGRQIVQQTRHICVMVMKHFPIILGIFLNKFADFIFARYNNGTRTCRNVSKRVGAFLLPLHTRLTVRLWGHAVKLWVTSFRLANTGPKQNGNPKAIIVQSKPTLDLRLYSLYIVSSYVWQHTPTTIVARDTRHAISAPCRLLERNECRHVPKCPSKGHAVQIVYGC